MRFYKTAWKNTKAFCVQHRLFWYFFGAIVYMETFTKWSTLGNVFNMGYVQMVLFSLPVALFMYAFANLFGEKGNRFMACVELAAVTLILGVQVGYHHIFSVFFTFYSIVGAEKAMQFWKEALVGIFRCLPVLIVVILPALALIIFGKKMFDFKRVHKKRAGVFAALGAAFQVLAVVAVMLRGQGVMSPRYLYSQAFVPELSVNQFGVLTTFRLDMRYMVTGSAPLPSLEVMNVSDPALQPNGPQDVSDCNVMDIDFDALIAAEEDPIVRALHQYFQSQQPTNQNEYTGMFKGKNLIWVTAESFSTYAIDETLTPTLYKMSREGFCFTNFYNPLWGVSTLDGEYVSMTGLLPKPGVWSMYKSGKNYMPFTMGNQMRSEGYQTWAYHNHEYDYYGRNESHPNLGYEYKGIGNGLQIAQTWPESDLEMVEATASEFVHNAPFHVYYLTVSGHLNYNFDNNDMAIKHQNDVANLPYSEGPRAYIACNMELDLAMQELVKRLDEAGVLEDTVIVISPDHYPYGLTEEELNELAGKELEQNFEKFKSTLIIWNSQMQPVTVDKLCSSLDILPTVSNLMGVEYDSRLMMGKDVFSNASPLVMFQNYSWMTDKGSYNTVADEFISVNGSAPSQAYIDSVTTMVNAKFLYSAKLLENDYYAKVFPNRLQ